MPHLYGDLEEPHNFEGPKPSFFNYPSLKQKLPGAAGRNYTPQGLRVIDALLADLYGGVGGGRGKKKLCPNFFSKNWVTKPAAEPGRPQFWIWTRSLPPPSRTRRASTARPPHLLYSVLPRSIARLSSVKVRWGPSMAGNPFRRPRPPRGKLRPLRHSLEASFHARSAWKRH